MLVEGGGTSRFIGTGQSFPDLSRRAGQAVMLKGQVVVRQMLKVDRIVLVLQREGLKGH